MQSWALCQSVNKIANGKFQAKLVDYCPDVLKNKNPLQPFGNMWDKDEQSRKMCELSLPAIHENFYKFQNFYNTQFNKTLKKYTSENFNEVMTDENLNGFICGSDTIFCIDEFEGFDDGYYANYPCMKNNYTVAYAVSFGDSHFDETTLKILNDRLKNFKAIALRESFMLDYVKEHVNVPVKQVIDPTLLLTSSDYENLIADKLSKTIPEKFILLYSRRYNSEMEKYAEILSERTGLEIVEISLRATNADKHIMFYEAGVEEFLYLSKKAEYIVTNSYHGMIFALQFGRNFTVFSREQGNSKINELLNLLGLSYKLAVHADDDIKPDINYDSVYKILNVERKEALNFLESELNGIN